MPYYYVAKKEGGGLETLNKRGRHTIETTQMDQLRLTIFIHYKYWWCPLPLFQMNGTKMYLLEQISAIYGSIINWFYCILPWIVMACLFHFRSFCYQFFCWPVLVEVSKSSYIYMSPFIGCHELCTPAGWTRIPKVLMDLNLVD